LDNDIHAIVIKPPLQVSLMSRMSSLVYKTHPHRFASVFVSRKRVETRPLYSAQRTSLPQASLSRRRSLITLERVGFQPHPFD